MIPVPTLAEVVQEHAKLDGLPFDAIFGLFIEAQLLQSTIAGFMIPAIASAGKLIVETDRALTIEEAAQRLRIAPATMQKWLRKSPYNAAVVVRSRTCVRVSAQRLEQILLDRGAGPRRKAATG